jgi:hypothetical protein
LFAASSERGVVIVGLYMLLWGKEKDQEVGSTGKEREQLEMDCEKQASDVYGAPKTTK